MTHAELLSSKIGTVRIELEPNLQATRTETAWRANHWEKVKGGIRTKSFYGRTAVEALAKAKSRQRQSAAAVRSKL